MNFVETENQPKNKALITYIFCFVLLTDIISIHIHIIRIAVMVVVLDVIVYPLKLIERVLFLSIVAVNRKVLIVTVEVTLVGVVVQRRLLVVFR